MPAEKATIKDAGQIHRLVNFFADRSEMLPRSLAEIYENIRDFFVAREDDQVIACAALHVAWSDLAEIKSTAVAEEYQRKGYGARLIEACLKEAKELGIETVFSLTYQPGFFAKMRFQEVDKMTLPRKIWTECYRCPKFPDCDEVALVYKVEV